MSFLSTRCPQGHPGARDSVDRTNAGNASSPLVQSDRRNSKFCVMFDLQRRISTSHLLSLQCLSRRFQRSTGQRVITAPDTSNANRNMFQPVMSWRLSRSSSGDRVLMKPSDRCAIANHASSQSIACINHSTSAQCTFCIYHGAGGTAIGV